MAAHDRRAAPVPRSGSPARRDDRTAEIRVLVVEDAFLTAETLAAMLGELGYTVVGPAPTLARAHGILDAERVDVALLDVNLRGRLVTSLADRLVELGRPFLFLTAYAGLDVLPERYRERPSLSKPCTREALAEALAALI